MPPDATQPNDAARRIDDPDVYSEIKAWAAVEIDSGRSFEDVVDALAANGWHSDDVTDVVEDARREVSDGRGARSAAHRAAAGFSKGPDFNVRNATYRYGLIGGLFVWIGKLFQNHNRKKK